MTEFAEWDSFYLIVGAAAGALIGLQFVVMTLIASSPGRPAQEAGSAFGTPTIIHFGAALFLSAILRAPFQTITPIATLWGLTGLVGVTYSLVVTRRMRMQSAYEPEFEDWLCHALLPLAAYAILVISAFAAFSYARNALFGVGASTLLLLFTGIHNAWDAVTYHVFTKMEAPEVEQPRED